MRFTSLSVATVAFAFGASLSAQSPLSTVAPFSANNAVANGGVVWFDLSASFQDVEITSIDLNCNTSVGGPIQITTLINPNGHAGNTTDPSGWTSIGVSLGTASTVNQPSNVVLNYPLCIPALTTIGVGIILDSGAAGFGHAYTSGAPGTVNNAEMQFSGGEVANAPFGSAFGSSVANLNFYYNSAPGVTCSQTGPVVLAATAETTAGAGTLVVADSDFYSGQILRWDFVDQFGNNAGNFAAVGLNFGSNPAVTAEVPGLEIRNSASAPAGTAFFLPPYTIGGGDYSLTTPSGPFFSFGNQVRIQGLMLDPAHALGSLPVAATNSIVFSNIPNCLVFEDFDALTAGSSGGVYPVGWADGGGDLEWRVRSGGTPSGGTGPSGASSAPNYMYTETSVGGTPTYIMNTDSYASAGLTGIAFDLSRVGAAMGPLEVKMGDGLGWYPVTVASYTGPASGDWNTQYVTLPTPLPATVQFQFHYTRGTSFTGDCAIDNFCVY